MSNFKNIEWFRSLLWKSWGDEFITLYQLVPCEKQRLIRLNTVNCPFIQQQSYLVNEILSSRYWGVTLSFTAIQSSERYKYKGLLIGAYYLNSLTQTPYILRDKETQGKSRVPTHDWFMSIFTKFFFFKMRLHRLLPQCLYIIVKKLSKGTSCVDMNKAMEIKKTIQPIMKFLWNDKHYSNYVLLALSMKQKS